MARYSFEKSPACAWRTPSEKVGQVGGPTTVPELGARPLSVSRPPRCTEFCSVAPPSRGLEGQPIPPPVPGGRGARSPLWTAGGPSRQGCRAGPRGLPGGEVATLGPLRRSQRPRPVRPGGLQDHRWRGHGRRRPRRDRVRDRRPDGVLAACTSRHGAGPRRLGRRDRARCTRVADLEELRRAPAGGDRHRRLAGHPGRPARRRPKGPDHEHGRPSLGGGRARGPRGRPPIMVPHPGPCHPAFRTR